VRAGERSAETRKKRNVADESKKGSGGLSAGTFCDINDEVKTRSRVLRAGFGAASADKFLSESVRILAERLTQSEFVPRLS